MSAAIEETAEKGLKKKRASKDSNPGLQNTTNWAT